MKNTKVILDLEKAVEEKVYRKLIEENWTKIDDFTNKMKEKIESDSIKYSKLITKELLKEVEILNKNK